MFQNISIRQQLLIVPIAIVLAFIYLYISISSSIEKLEDKSIKASISNNIIKQMLEARINEKNYIRRKDPKYVNELQILVKDSLQKSIKLKQSFHQEENQKLIENVIVNIKEYISLFNKFNTLREDSLKMQLIMVQEANDVEEIASIIRSIQKEQRDKLIHSTNDVKAIADEIEEASLVNKIVKELLMMRISEKNYLRRKDIKYQDEVELAIKNINKLALHVKSILDSKKNKIMMDKISQALQEYKKAFNQFSMLREESIKVSQKMKKEANQSKQALIKLRTDQKVEKILLGKHLKRNMIIIFIFIGFSIIMFMLIVSTVIRRRLKQIYDAAKELASGDGDLTRRINIEGNNELANVAKCINIFIQKVQDAISESKTVSTEASSISNELSTTSLEIGKRVEDEASLVKSINEDTQKTTQEAEFVGKMANEMHKISENSFNALSETTQKINTLISTVKESSIKEEELALKMQELKESTNNVKSILELIGDIAEQTNLLSLNAAIEAARAGEHGRGFAVVADEVRKLAEGTQKSLVEINATINVVTQGVDEASDNMQANAQDIAESVGKASDVEESIDNVMESITKSKAMSQESSEAVEKLKNRVVEISDKMLKLNDVSISNARSVEEIAAAAEHQNDIIDKLNTQLSSFKS